MIENSEIQFKEKMVENLAKLKELQIQFLQDQLKLRDEVIEDQKNMLMKGGGSLHQKKISYDALKNAEEIEDEAKLNYPKMKNRLDYYSKPDNSLNLLVQKSSQISRGGEISGVSGVAQNRRYYHQKFQPQQTPMGVKFPLLGGK